MLRLVLALVLLLPIPAALADITGKPRVVDGDTIIIRKTRIRLHGIDAPEYKQECSVDGRLWSCGMAAKTVLMQAIGHKRVNCVSKPMDGDKPTDRRQLVLAVCRAGSLNLNEWMVKKGWAVAFRRHTTDYVDAEQTARRKRRGVWIGTFTPPSEWRRQRRK